MDKLVKLRVLSKTNLISVFFYYNPPYSIAGFIYKCLMQYWGYLWKIWSKLFFELCSIIEAKLEQKNPSCLIGKKSTINIGKQVGRICHLRVLLFILSFFIVKLNINCFFVFVLYWLPISIWQWGDTDVEMYIKKYSNTKKNTLNFFSCVCYK